LNWDEAGEKYLCAYIVSYPHKSAALNTTGLHEYLSRELPDYMVPAYFMVLEKMPLNPNGKVDRKALPEPDLTSKNNYVPPQNDTETRLAEIWAEVLGVDKKKVSIHDNFFLSGGHSLKATTLIGKIHKAFRVEIPIAEIFKQPTIKNISRYIEQSKESLYSSIAPVEKKEYYPLSSAQIRLFVIDQMDPGNITYNIPEVLILEGKFDRSCFAESFKKLIARHESLRTSFQLIAGEPVQKVHFDVKFEIEYDQSLVNGHWSLVNCQVRGKVSSPIKVEEGDTKGTRGLAPLPVEIAERKAQSAGRKEKRHAPCVVRCASTIKNFIRPFDLSKAPLLRVGLIKLPHTPFTPGSHSRLGTHNSQEGRENKYLLMFDMHHIISDGISMQIFIKEFTALYKGEVIPGLRIQYKDFSHWQNALMDSDAIKQQESYW
jgi:tyrocidine synthetase-3